ncbi:MAG: hypothetical protein ACYDBQ_04500 [Thermoplasmatota archaeon]
MAILRHSWAVLAAVILAAPALGAGGTPGIIIGGSNNGYYTVTTANPGGFVNSPPPAYDDNLIGAGTFNLITDYQAASFASGPTANAPPPTPYVSVYSSGIMAGGGESGYNLPGQGGEGVITGGNFIGQAMNPLPVPLNPMEPCPPYPPTPPTPSPPGWAVPINFLCNDYYPTWSDTTDSFVGAGGLNQILSSSRSAIVGGSGSSVIHQELDIPWMPICGNDAIDHYALVTTPPDQFKELPCSAPVPLGCPIAYGAPCNRVPCGPGVVACSTQGCLGVTLQPCYPDDQATQPETCVDDGALAYVANPSVGILPENLPLTQSQYNYPQNNAQNGKWYPYPIAPAPLTAGEASFPADPNYLPNAPAHNQNLPLTYRSPGRTETSKCDKMPFIYVHRMAADSLVGGGQDHIITDPGSGIWSGLHGFVNGSASAILGGLNNIVQWENQDPGPLHYDDLCNGLPGTRATAALTVLNNAVISGGQTNFDKRSNTFVGGGSSNAIQYYENSSILGGFGNMLGGTPVPFPAGHPAAPDCPGAQYVSVQDGFIGAGFGNGMNGQGQWQSGHGAIGGGTSNMVFGFNSFSAIVGGIRNTAASTAFVGGGINNSAVAGAVGGGSTNLATGGAVAGGTMNVVYTAPNVRTLTNNAVLGGTGSHTDGQDDFLGGGMNDNQAHGESSGVLGGVRNAAYGDRSFVVGGTAGLALGAMAGILGGNVTQAGAWTGVGGGAMNLATGTASGIMGGSDNVASAGRTLPSEGSAYVGGGTGSTVSAADSAVAGGGGALADNPGEIAYGSGTFGDLRGGAQSVDLVVQGKTPGAAPAPLLLPGGQVIKVPLNSAWSVSGMAVARDVYGNSHGWSFSGAIKNRNGVVSMTGVPGVTTVRTDVAALMWTVSLNADSNTGALTLTGSATAPARFVAQIQLVQVRS